MLPAVLLLVGTGGIAVWTAILQQLQRAFSCCCMGHAHLRSPHE